MYQKAVRVGPLQQKAPTDEPREEGRTFGLLPFEKYVPKKNLSQFDWGLLPNKQRVMIENDGRLLPKKFGFEDSYDPFLCFEFAWTMGRCRYQDLPGGCPLNHERPSAFWCYIARSTGRATQEHIDWIL